MIEKWYLIEEEKFPYNYLERPTIESQKIPEVSAANIEKESTKVPVPEKLASSNIKPRIAKQETNISKEEQKTQSCLKKVKIPCLNESLKPLENEESESLPKVNPRKFKNEEPQIRKIAKIEVPKFPEAKMSIFCPSKPCPFVSASINELIEHIKQAHKFTCSIPQCRYSTQCLCKLAEHVQASHSNYKPVSLNSSRLLRKYLQPISNNVEISKQREYINKDGESDEDEEESFSLMSKMKEVKKNDPSLVLSKIRKC